MFAVYGDGGEAMDRGTKERPGEIPSPLAAGLGQNGTVPLVPKVPGHSIRVTQPDGHKYWSVVCTCGFGAPRRGMDHPQRFQLEAVAVTAAVRHVRWAAKESERQARLNGLSTTPLHRRASLG